MTADFAKLSADARPERSHHVDDYLEAGARGRAAYRDRRKPERAIAGLPALERPLGIPDVFDEHVKLMYELQWLAFQADLTRVVTFMLGRELNFRTYPEIGFNEGHHGLSHHGDRPEQIEKLARLNTYQAELFAGFLAKLKATPDGDGTLLDHSLFLYGASLSNPNLHAHYDLPLTLVGGAGGTLKGDRHLVFPAETPMTNLLLAMLDKVGVPTETLGDSTGAWHLAVRSAPLRCLIFALCAANACAAWAGDLSSTLKTGNSAAARALLAERADPDDTDADGTTALHWAIHHADADLAKALLDAGAKVDARNRYGVPPLTSRPRTATPTWSCAARARRRREHRIARRRDRADDGRAHRRHRHARRATRRRRTRQRPRRLERADGADVGRAREQRGGGRHAARRRRRARRALDGRRLHGALVRRSRGASSRPREPCWKQERTRTRRCSTAPARSCSRP